MQTRALVLTALSSLGALGLVAQERVKQKGPADFATVHAAIAEHWKAERWGQSFAAARELLGLISVRRAKAIRDAMPAAPAGYTVEPVTDEASMQTNALLGAMAAGVGSVIEQTYNGPDKQVRVTVTADSPMLQMFNMIVQNPAMLQPNQELVKYSECSALLETQGQDVSLRFMLGDSMIEASFQGVDADFALKMFDQAAVTALHKVITN